jgi:hypothetical protein
MDLWGLFTPGYWWQPPKKGLAERLFQNLKTLQGENGKTHGSTIQAIV